MQPTIKYGYAKSCKGLLSACFITALAPGAEARNDLTRPLVPMSEYQFDYRTLNCWECFEAQGRMCHFEDYAHNQLLLQSANRGDGVCCKNSVEGDGVCSSDYQDLHCSMPSFLEQEEQDGSIHSSVFSPNKRNYQMFAFCPGIEPVKCGVGADHESLEFNLHA